MPLKPRDLIIDNWNREGIVVERVKRPAAAWIADQTDNRVRALPSDTVCWNVLGIRGGSGIVPEPLARFVREGTIEDAMRAVEYANEHSLRTIAFLFPEAVERAVRQRQKGTLRPDTEPLPVIAAPKGHQQTSPGQRPGLMEGKDDKP